MAKDYTVTRLDDILIRIKIPAQNVETNKYHAAMISIQGIAKNGTFGFPVKRPDVYLGTGKDVPWTNKEVYTALQNYNTMNTFLANELKQLYIEAINVDPSA